MECSILMMQKRASYLVLAKLEPSFVSSIRNSALYWPYPSNLEVTLRNARELSETSEAFFTEKIKQEVDVRKIGVE